MDPNHSDNVAPLALGSDTHGLHWVDPHGTVLWATHVIENSVDAIISHDLDGTITSWNPAAHRMYGYSPADVIGQSIRLIVPLDRQHEEDLALMRVRSGDRVEPFDTVRVPKDGSLVDIALTVSPIRDREGRIIGASKIARDISDRKRIEARDHFLIRLDDAVRPLIDVDEVTLTAAASLGRHLGVNRCAYAVVEDDQDTFITTGNFTDGVDSLTGRHTFRQFGEEYLRLMGAGEPCAVSDTKTDPRITEADRPSYAAAMIRAMVCVPILKQGRFVAAMSVHAIVPRPWLPDEIELVQRVAGRCWECIERARLTQHLKESEHQFRELANSIANLAWMARPDGSAYWFNDQWYAYTATSPAEGIRRGWQHVHHPDSFTEVSERWAQSVRTGTPFEMVFPLRAANGEYRRFLTRANPVRDSQGRVAHWFGTNTDVEDERRATEANALLRKREQVAREEAEL